MNTDINKRKARAISELRPYGDCCSDSAAGMNRALWNPLTASQPLRYRQ